MVAELNVPKAKVYPVLPGKVAIVTGSAQGMGKETALMFAEAGASVVLADVNEPAMKEVVAQIEKLGGRAHAVKTDISSSSDVQNLVNEAVAKFGRLDYAVNNAALTPDDEPINLKGTALCNKYEIAQMRKQGTGGSIVNISSVVAYHAHANMVAHTTSKHAIVGLTKQAAIAPGAILTEMSAKALSTMGTDHVEYAKQVSMLGRWAAPHEVAQASLWLCSDASSYGKLAIVTGGARGIGAAIAENLAQKGCSTVLIYKSSSSDTLAASLASRLESQYSVRSIPIREDITTEEGCSALIQKIKAVFQPTGTGRFQIDIVINNAAIAILAPLGSVQVTDFYKVQKTNVLGPILIMQACLPYLPHDRSGRIVNISSIGSSVGEANQTVYAASKGGLEAMTRVWARELAERATVNIINPGPVMTDMYLKQPTEIKKTLALWNPVTPLSKINDLDTDEVKRMGEELGGRAAYDWEVAGTVGMLCSPDARWTTGSVISANGGLRFSY
ncbi:hypothetical protein F5884DRAFT_816469 [Xylogone sp. PMI_703]|nr:hypothetical protein F5884DRAFT_816469 [Xylogone sp. PMI_703]